MDWMVTPERAVMALALVGGYTALCGGIWGRLRRQRQAVLAEAQSLASGEGAAPVLVVYASQTGQAEALARETAQVLHAGGCAVRLLAVEALTLADLQACTHSLWLLSTCGEGDAPDHALAFVDRVLATAPDLVGHHYQLLALGDRSYAQFCAFGLRVQAWLAQQGAAGEALCMDNGDASSLQDWRDAVDTLLQARTGRQAVWPHALPFTPWVLRKRSHLNPGSQGGAVYLLEWSPADAALPHWESGDLVEVQVPSDPGRARDYSIASLPSSGSLQLLVRQSLRADGSPGLASGWLCAGMAVGSSLPMRLRAHRHFRLGDNQQRPLILVGNGTGLAGLMSHLHARIAQGLSEQWLVFGERSPQHDKLLDGQLQAWLGQGQLARLDQAWSRHAQHPAYVQQVLARAADELRAWVARGAALYVCGSQQGMAQGVDQVLREVLGEGQVEALYAQGRYRRDVY